VSGAAVERETSAEEAGLRATTSMTEAPVLIEGCCSQDGVEVDRGCVRVVSQPVAGTAREHDHVAGEKRGVLLLAGYLQPAATSGDDVKRRVAVRLDTESPRRAHHGATVDRAANVHPSEKLADPIGGVEVAK
jgi:hypothetical protein